MSSKLLLSNLTVLYKNNFIRNSRIITFIILQGKFTLMKNINKLVNICVHTKISNRYDEIALRNYFLATICT